MMTPSAVTEVVEAEGHLIDSQLLNVDLRHRGQPRRVVRRAEVPHRPHQRRAVVVSMRISSGSPAALPSVLEELVALGCRVARAEDAPRRRRRSRRLRARRLLLDDQPPDLGPPRRPVDRGRAPAHGCRRSSSTGRARSAASCATSAAATRRVRRRRHPRRAGVPGARPPRLRVHDQRDLVRAPRRGRRVAHRGDDARGQGRRRPYRLRRRPGGRPHRRRRLLLRPDSRRLRRRAARRQRAGGARRRAGAVRHLARRGPGDRQARSKAAIATTCARSTPSAAPVACARRWSRAS